MGKPSEAKAFGEWCLEQAVPDIIVNNAGQFLPGSIFMMKKKDTLEQMIEVNLYSAYHLTRILVPR
jgi:NAD(P)-dependent dehydrogenase (short-subunit alcohol dehydrogenase family)